MDISKVILGTSSYDNCKKGNTLSITGDGGNAWNYYGPAYKSLAPKLTTYIKYSEQYKELQNINNKEEYILFRKQIEDEYIKSYYELRLKNLDVEQLLYKLYIKYGENIILLCHEPINEFCHRRLVADYIELMTNNYIPEITMDKDNNVKKLMPIRYKNRLRNVINK